MQKLKDMIMKEIREDEKEYCFDKCYCPDEDWKKQYGSETREEAYKKAVKCFENMTVQQILDYTGDKYIYVLDIYNAQTSR